MDDFKNCDKNKDKLLFVLKKATVYKWWHIFGSGEGFNKTSILFYVTNSTTRSH